MHSELIAVALFLSFTLRGLDANFLIILFQSSQVFTGLAELTIFHSLADVPVDKGALAVHEVKLVINAREHFSNGSGIADHAACTHYLSQVASRNHGGRLVVDAALEACGTPVHELDGALGLDRCDRSIHVLGHDVTTIHHAASHVLAMTRIALHKH